MEPLKAGQFAKVSIFRSNMQGIYEFFWHQQAVLAKFCKTHQKAHIKECPKKCTKKSRPEKWGPKKCTKNLPPLKHQNCAPKNTDSKKQTKKEHQTPKMCAQCKWSTPTKRWLPSTCGNWQVTSLGCYNKKN